jgi:protein SCO1/2
MNKLMILAPAVVLIAGGLLTVVTATAYYMRTRDDVASGSSGPIYDHGDWQNTKLLEEFTLTERSGELFHSKDMQGQVWVVNFFFANCPGYCTQQSTRVGELAKEWGPKGVAFVSITVDPEQDTPAVLREYAHKFHADPEQWLFLTGDLLHIRRIGVEIFQHATDRQAHSEQLILVDRWGNLRGSFSWKDYEELQAMKNKLDELLAETEPPKLEEQPVKPDFKFDEESGRFVPNA